jgi:single-strand DNA-binding protein
MVFLLALFCGGPQLSLSFTCLSSVSSPSLPTACKQSSSRPFSLRPIFSFSNEDDLVGYDDDEEDGEPRLSDEELEATMTEWDEQVPMFNTVHITGRVGNTPEPRYFDDGKVVVNLSVANRRKYHNIERLHEGIQTGEEETDWYRCEIWGRTAEYVAKYVDKGMRVSVVGSLNIDSWVDKDTQENRSSAKLIVRDFDILETRAESELRRGGGASSNNQRRGPAFYTSDSDDDGGFGSAGSGGFFDN